MLGVMLAQAQVADDIYGDNVDLTIVTPAKQDKDTKKAEKEHKKLMKQRVDSLGHAKAAAALERGYWVIVADRINVGTWATPSADSTPTPTLSSSRRRRGWCSLHLTTADLA